MASGSWFHNFRTIAAKDADLEQKNIMSIELSIIMIQDQILTVQPMLRIKSFLKEI